MDEKNTPYLYNSGLRLDFEQLKTKTEFTDTMRLSDGKTFTNGMMSELRKLLKISNDMFYNFLKSILPLSILNDENFPKTAKLFFSNKMKSFDSTYISKRKTKTLLREFLNKEFVFVTVKPQQQQGTPEKRGLRKRISELEDENEELNQSRIDVQNELDKIQNDLLLKEEEIETTRNKLLILEQEKFSLQQKIRGITKSGIERKKAKQETVNPPAVTSSVSNSSSVSTNTLINNIVKKDVVVLGEITKKNVVALNKESVEEIFFTGQRFYGNQNPHKKCSSGKQNAYFEFALHNKICSKIDKKEIQKRAKLVNKFSSYVAGSSSEEECSLLFTELVKANKDLFNEFKKCWLSSNGYLICETSVEYTIITAKANEQN